MAQSEFDYHSIPPGYYDEVFHRNQGIQSKWHHLKFLGIRKTLEALGHGSVLDVGCGPGTFAGVLPDFDYTGIDLSPIQIEYAQKKYGDSRHRFQALKAGEMGFGANHFDFVTSVDVIEHIPRKEAETMLRSAMACLKPGGWVVISTPNYRSHWPLLEILVSKLSPMDYVDQHITHYTAPVLRDMLSQIGFVNIDVRSFIHSALFLAGISWKLSDWMFAAEFKGLRPFGANLLAKAQKPI